MTRGKSVCRPVRPGDLIGRPRPSTIPPGKMKQVIIYARYSSDLQNDRSVEDQIASCKRLVHGDEVVTAVYSDRGVSGAFMQNRERVRDMMRDIEAGPSRWS